MRFNRITLTPVTVTATGLQPIAGAVGPVLRLRVRLPKGSLVPQSSGATFVPQGTAFPYSVQYGGPSQTSPTLLTPNTGAKILGKPTLKYGKAKPIKISTSSPTFQLSTAGSASALCANGTGGAIGTAVSGCAQCAAGSFGSAFEQSTPCKLCSSVSSNSISAQAGASSCTNCTAGTTPNANGTACTGGPVTPVTTSFSMTAAGPCSDTVRAQIKASQEAFLLSQPGVQSATVTVTCTAVARRRALLQTNGTVVYTSSVSCTGTSSTNQCTASFTALGAQVVSCCTVPKPSTCTIPLVTPTNCTGTNTTGTGCAPNFYNANGTCVSCGTGATSPGGSVTSCTCTNGGTWSSSTGCPTGITCAAGTYFVAGACAPCPANSYCVGGIGTAAVATPCPGTTSTAGFTAQTSVLACVQGNFFRTAASNAAQNWTSIASFGGIQTKATTGVAPTEGKIRVASAANGLLYGTEDAGATWSAIGPDSANRTWRAISTCQAPDEIDAITAQAPLAVVAVADNGGIWLAVSDTNAVLPTSGRWVKISAVSGSTAPLDSLAYTSVACAVPIIGTTAPTGSKIYVIASSGGPSGQLWLGSAAVPDYSTTRSTPAASDFTWAQVSGTSVGVGDFSSVAAAVAGDASAKQGVAFIAASKGASGKLFTAKAADASSLSGPASVTWNARTVTVATVAQTNFVSVDIAAQTGTAGTVIDTMPAVVAIGSGRVVSSADTGTNWPNVLSASDQPWSSVDLNFAGGAVAAAASTGGIWYSASPANPGTLTNTTVAAEAKQAYLVPSTQAWTDIALIGTTGGVAGTAGITATLPGFVGWGIQQGGFSTTAGVTTWTNAAASTSRVWVDIATSASGARVIAITATDVYISNNNGSSWSASVFTGAGFASVSTDSTGSTIAVLSTTTDRVYTSADGGVTWGTVGAQLTNGASTPVVATEAIRVSVNTDGSRIYATTSATGTAPTSADGFIYVSTNKGQTFAQASSVVQRDWDYIEAGSGLNVVASTKITGTGASTVYKSIDGAVTLVAQTTGITAGKLWKVQSSADGTVLAVLDATTGLEAYTATCTLGTTTCASWTKLAPTVSGTAFPTSGLQAISLSADGSRLFIASNGAAPSGGIWTGSAAATVGTFNWIGPKLAGATETSIANLASSSNGGNVYGAATTGGAAGGPTSTLAFGQIWSGFGAV